MLVTPVGVRDGCPVGLSLYRRHQRVGDSVVSGATRVARSGAIERNVPRPHPFPLKVSLQVLRSGAEM